MTWGRFGNPTDIHLSTAGQQAPQPSMERLLDARVITAPNMVRFRTRVAREAVPILEHLIAEAALPRRVE